MRVFSIQFTGLYLMGFAIVVADDKAEARRLFKDKLKREHEYLWDKNQAAGSIEITDVGAANEYGLTHIQWNGDY